MSGCPPYENPTFTYPIYIRSNDGSVTVKKPGNWVWDLSVNAYNNSVLSVSGTTNVITSTGGQNPVIDISPDYIGQSSITTLGTITTGIWEGSPIVDSFISSSSSWNNKLNPNGNGSSLTGITPYQIGLGNVENTSLSTWEGSSNIINVGTVTTGTWNANPIIPSKGGNPTGGATGQVLQKNSGTDYDYSWNTITNVDSFNGRTGAVVPQSGDYTFAQIGSKPTTLSGYGITDAVSSSDPVITNAILQGGNSFGTTMSIGTNDANTVRIRINGADRWGFSSGNLSNQVDTTWFTMFNGNSTAPASITRNTATSYSVFAFNNANAGSTGNILDFQKIGVTQSYIDNTGNFFSQKGSPLLIGTKDANTVNFVYNNIISARIIGNSIVHGTDSGNLNFNFGSSGSSGYILRNVPTSVSVFAFNNANASSTGNILDFQNQGSTKSFIDVDGNFLSNKGSALNIGTVDAQLLNLKVNNSNIVSISSTGINNPDNSSYFFLGLGSFSVPALISRNTSNAVSVLRINNQSVSSTGNLLDFTAGSSAPLTSFAKDGSLTFGNTASANGAVLYNTADQTTNYEKVSLKWVLNVATLLTENGGTGTVRALRLIGGDNRQFTVQNPLLTGAFNGTLSTATTNVSGIGSSSNWSSASGINNSLAILDTYNQSGSAGYRGIWISLYEQATGDGPKLLADLGTNSAANGSGTHTSKFSVTNTGRIFFADCPEYADNSAATTAGLVVGTVYRTGDTLKIVHS